jgi:hypothetical protein
LEKKKILVIREGNWLDLDSIKVVLYYSMYLR